MALRQHRETVVVPAGRGTIVDRTGEPLAIGRLATTIYANPRQVDDARDLTLAAGKYLGSDPAVLYPTLVDRSRGFVYVARKADPRKAEKLEKLGYAGLGFYPEELRYYPQGPVAAQILGYAGLDNKGLEGLERSLEGRSQAVPEARRSSRTRSVVRSTSSRRSRRRPARTSGSRIDRQIQANAEEVLQETVRRWSARSATAVVMDPQTGAILAMATAPRFNANRFATTRADRRRNRAVTDTYEPGSTFKLVTVAAALQEGIVNPRSSFLLAPTLKVADRTIREAHARGTRADDRATDRRVLVEHRHDHDRAAPRRAAARLVDRPLRLREEHWHRLPGRVGGLRAAARPVVGLDDRHGADRSRHRRHARADGARVLGRSRTAGRSFDLTSSTASTARSVAAQQGTSCRVARRLRADALDAARRRRRGNGHRGGDTRLHGRRQDGNGGEDRPERPVLDLSLRRVLRRPRAGVEAEARRHGHGRRAARRLLRRRRRGPGVPRNRSLQPPVPRDPARRSEDGTLTTRTSDGRSGREADAFSGLSPIAAPRERIPVLQDSSAYAFSSLWHGGARCPDPGPRAERGGRGPAGHDRRSRVRHPKRLSAARSSSAFAESASTGTTSRGRRSNAVRRRSSSSGCSTSTCRSSSFRRPASRWPSRRTSSSESRRRSSSSRA